MTFPLIETIDDVLPSIEGRKEFVTVNHGDYTSIDYVYAEPDSFDDPIRLECRGIKFAKGGTLLARPLHKFFNVGEKEHTQPHTIDFSLPHVITEKLDGSMIHPAFIRGRIRLMTRRGITDTALAAEAECLTPAVEEFCNVETATGYTPIFEYTSPRNRIVLAYPSPRLTLLAIRDNRSGRYVTHDEVMVAATAAGIPFVGHRSSEWSSVLGFADYVRDRQGIEGYVVRFDCGRTVKLKCLDYVTKHRAKSSICAEKNVLQLIVTDRLDDLLPLLDEHDREHVLAYAAEVNKGIRETVAHVESRLKAGKDLDQKQFALTIANAANPRLRPILYSARKLGFPDLVVREYIASSTSSQARVDEVRPLFGARYNYAPSSELQESA
jgi:RNA ligase